MKQAQAAVQLPFTSSTMAVDNLRPLAYVIISIAFALGTVSILLRLYCRWRLRTLGRDDAAAVFLFVWLPASGASLTLSA